MKIDLQLAVRTRRTLPIIKKFLCDDAALLSALFASIDCQKKVGCQVGLVRLEMTVSIDANPRAVASYIWPTTQARFSTEMGYRAGGRLPK